MSLTILDSGYSLLVARCWLGETGNWILDAGLLLIARCRSGEVILINPKSEIENPKSCLNHAFV
jgi:hypothetical protein